MQGYAQVLECCVDFAGHLEYGDGVFAGNLRIGEVCEAVVQEYLTPERGHFSELLGEYLPDFVREDPVGVEVLQHGDVVLQQAIGYII